MYDQVSLIDTHVHIWKISRGDYGWLTPSLESLYRDFDVADYKVNMNSYHMHRVDGIILIQAAPTRQETEYLMEQARKEPLVKGVVGWCDMLGGASTIEWLQSIRLQGRCSSTTGPILLGVRPMLQDIEQDDWILKEEASVVLNYLQDQGIILELLIQPRHLKHIKTLVQRYPSLKMVIDHAAKPIITSHSNNTTSSNAFAEWSNDMKWFGDNAPNVMCKISGMYNQYRPTPPSSSSSSISSSPSSSTSVDNLILTFIQHLLRCFTHTRLLWGSDFPVHNESQYQEWLVLTHKAFQHLSTQEQQNIYSNNAIRFYKV